MKNIYRILVGKPVGIYIYISIWQSQKCLANNSKMEYKKVGCGGRELRGSNSG